MQRAPVAVSVAVALVALTACDPFQPWRHELVSGTPEGVGGNGGSSMGTAADFDRSMVVFVSDADDLVPGDGNGASDVFARDVDTGATQLVSVASGSEGPGNGESSQPVVSNDGTKVAFASVATNLVGETVSGAGDVYVRDLAAGTTRLVSVDAAGSGGGNGPSRGPTFSSDNRRLAFSSQASNLGPNDANGVSDVYVRDVVGASTSLASINAAGTAAGDGPSQSPSWAWYGAPTDSLAFESRANDLTSPGDSGTTWDVYVRRMATGPTVLASPRSDGGGGGNGDSRHPVHGGDLVVFQSDASDLGATDGNATTDIYARDLTGATTSLVSANPAGGAGNGSSTWPVVGEGIIWFQSDASDLVATDTNGTTDIFRRIGSSLTLESVNAAGDDSGNGASTMPGQLLYTGDLAFNSEATDLGPTDTNGVSDVYTRHYTGVTHAVSTNRSQRTTGNGPSRLTTPRNQHWPGPALFESEASDLGPSVGGSTQIYLSRFSGGNVVLESLQVIQVAGEAELLITVRNYGPETAEGVTAIIELPPGVTLAPTDTSSCHSVPDAPGALVCPLRDMGPDDLSFPSVLLRIDAPAGTEFELRVLVGSQSYDPSPNPVQSVQFTYDPPDP